MLPLYSDEEGPLPMRTSFGLSSVTYSDFAAVFWLLIIVKYGGETVVWNKESAL